LGEAEAKEWRALFNACRVNFGQWAADKKGWRASQTVNPVA
jgi:hypothetical protein